jgi:transaldolase
MELRLDTASVDEIRAAARFGIISGVTTNPSLRAKAASLLHSRHVTEAARAGAHIATMPYAAFMAMFKHPFTDVGMQRFLEDAEHPEHNGWQRPGYNAFDLNVENRSSILQMLPKVTAKSPSAGR